jgi:Ni/Co efflux regulator RcnB
MRHLLASAIAISLLAGSLSPVIASADSRGDRGGRHERHLNDRGHDRGRAHHNDGRRYDGRADHRRDYRSDDRRWDSRSRDNRHWDRGRAHDHHGRRFDGRYDGHRYSESRRYYPSHRPDYRYGHSHSKRFYGGAYYRPYGYRYYSWRHGDYLPGAYYAPRYIVRDYRAYRLYAPPRGYHWVRVDNDVVLAAIASGLVVSVVSNLFY